MKTYLTSIFLIITMSCKDFNSKKEDTRKIINYYHGIVLNENDEVLSDGAGNINVNDITFTAGKNITITAGINITSSAGANISESAGMNHSSSACAMMMQNAVADYSLMAANITEVAQGKRRLSKRNK